MEELIPILLGILVVPFLVVILLIVYIAKTNRLSRDTSALQSDVSALRAELARLTRSLASAEHQEMTQAEATIAGADRQPVSEHATGSVRKQASESASLDVPPVAPELVPPGVPSAPARQPKVREAYVSPYRRPIEPAQVETGAPPSQPMAAPDQGESELSASTTVASATGASATAASATASRPAGFLRIGGYGNRSRPVPRPSRTRAEWESLIGGRLLNWIGALATIIGIGFFLRYAFQNNWITPALRVGIGALAGFVLLGAGDLSFRKGYRIFSQGLVGAGLSVLYLSAYASFNFYRLEDQAMAFALMSAVTVLTFIQAFRFNSLAVSILGWAGGFLTPVLLSTGQANEAALFGYISILDAGLLAIIALKDDWLVLEPLTLVATYIIYLAWYADFYTANDLPRTAIFLTVFWGLFYALDVSEIVRTAKKYLAAREIVAVMSSVFYYAALYSILDPDHHAYLATVTLGLGAAYLATIAALKRFNPARVTEARFALTGAVLLVIATALRFSGFDTVFCWSMEALALVLAAVYWNEPGVLGGAAALYLAAIVKLLATSGCYSYGAAEGFVPLLNRRALAFLGLAAAGALAAEAIRRGGRAASKAITALFEYSWGLALFVLLAVETMDGFGRLISAGGDPQWLQWLEFVMYLAIGVGWMVYALALAAHGAGHRVRAALDIGLFAAGASICTVAIAGFSYQPISDFSPIINVRAGAFAAVLIGLLIFLGWTGRGLQSKNWPAWSHGAFMAVFCLMIFVLCTAETRDYFARILDLAHRANATNSVDGKLDEALRKYTNQQQVALSLVWLVYSILLIGYGIWRRMLSLRIIAIIIFGIAILKIFIYDLSFLETLYRIFSFIGLGLILLSVSFLYQRFKSAIFETAGPPQPQS
jgi:uncharacterized membrane protein